MKSKEIFPIMWRPLEATAPLAPIQPVLPNGPTALRYTHTQS